MPPVTYVDDLLFLAKGVGAMAATLGHPSVPLVGRGPFLLEKVQWGLKCGVDRLPGGCWILRAWYERETPQVGQGLDQQNSGQQGCQGGRVPVSLGEVGLYDGGLHTFEADAGAIL